MFYLIFRSILLQKELFLGPSADVKLKLFSHVWHEGVALTCRRANRYLSIRNTRCFVTNNLSHIELILANILLVQEIHKIEKLLATRPYDPLGC